MTDEEKKEFEEFLEWKRQKAAKEQTTSENKPKPEEQIDNPPQQEVTAQQNSGDSKTNQETKGRDSFGLAILAILVFTILFSLFMSSIKKNTSKIAEIDSVAVEENTIDTVVKFDIPEPVLVKWRITDDIDAMTDTKNIWAIITSDDYIRQDFPYDGLTYASITVRYMKKYGYDVLIEITKGQIDGREYYGTNYITVRFDGGAPKKYYYNEAADGSADVVFLKSSSDFIKKCKKAKDIIIDIPIYQSGRPVFSFHVDEPLVWPN